MSDREEEDADHSSEAERRRNGSQVRLLKQHWKLHTKEACDSETKLHVPKRGVSIPLKCIDFHRQIKTSLDVLQHKSINDNWNVDGDHLLSDPMDWCDKIHCVTHMSSGRIDRQRNRRQQDLNMFGQNIWSSMSKSSECEGKKARESVKPKLDAARSQREIYCIVADDHEFDDLLKNARRT